jgi:hypothetical protein
MRPTVTDQNSLRNPLNALLGAERVSESAQLSLLALPRKMTRLMQPMQKAARLVSNDPPKLSEN